MDPTSLIPPADALPAAPWLLRLLLDATFAAHLLLMNAMLGLTLLGFARSLRQSEGLARQASLVPTLTALAVNVGVAPFLFLQTLYGQYLYVGFMLMGVFWVGLVLAVMAAYGLAYRQKYALGHTPHGRTGPRGTLVWGGMALLMLYASLVQVNNALLLQRPDFWSGFFENASGTMTAFADRTFVPRWLHFVLASVSVGGLSLAMVGRGRSRRGDPHGAGLQAEGLRWFSHGALGTAAVGLWWLMSLPREALLAFMGGDALGTGLLLGGVASAGAAVAFGLRGKTIPAACGAVATVCFMVPLREVLRQIQLAPYFNAEAMSVRPEPTTVAMFLGCMGISLAVVWWAAARPVPDKKGA